MALSVIDHLTDEMDRCVDSCFDADQACEWYADEGEGMARCLRLCRDVADLTTQCARLCSRDSTFYTQTIEP
jgi:ABC-type tungstate transport system permease subunit